MKKFNYLAIILCLTLSCSSKKGATVKKERAKPLFREQCQMKNGQLDQGACFCKYSGEYFNPFKFNCQSDD